MCESQEQEKGEIVIERVDGDESIKYLGLNIAADGNMKDELKDRIEQAIAFGEKVLHSSLSRTEARMAYYKVWVPKIGYAVPITTFTKEEGEEISSIVWNRVLPKMGYSRKIARGIVKGEKSLGGLGMEDVYVQQGIEHVYHMVGHIRQQDEIGILMKIEMECLQLVIGSGDFFWELEWKKYNYIEERGWISSVWEFVSRYKVTIKVEGMWKPRIGREEDKYIMDEVVRLGA